MEVELADLHVIDIAAEMAPDGLLVGERVEWDDVKREPNPLHLLIAEEVVKLGRAHMFNLGCCSTQWLAVCKDVMRCVSVHASKLTGLLSILNTIPKPKHLTIRSETFAAFKIGSRALNSLHVDLEGLSLTSSDYRKVEGVNVSLASGFRGEASPTESTSERTAEGKLRKRQKHSYAFEVEDLRMLTQPFHPTLTHLNLDHCSIWGMVGSSSEAFSFLTGLPCLQTLKLVSVRASTVSGAAVTTLKLTGCTILQHLLCYDSSFPVLDATGCAALKVVDCHASHVNTLTVGGCGRLVSLNCDSNPMVNLDLNHCPCLANLQCSNMSLGNVKIDPSARLQTLTCVGCGNFDFPKIGGGTSVLNLTCNSGQIKWLGEGIIKGVERITIPTPVRKHVRGFRNLNYASIKFASSNCGDVDFSGCSLLDVCCYSEAEHLPISGRHAVLNLTLLLHCLASPDLQGFTNMQELHVTLHQQLHLNLWGCTALQKVTVTMFPGNHAPMYSLKLPTQPALEELRLDGFQYLTGLDLAACTRLKILSLVDNGLQTLDTSPCRFLRALDVTSSRWLQSIEIHSSNLVLEVKSGGCEKLLNAPIRRVSGTVMPTTSGPVQAAALPATSGPVQKEGCSSSGSELWKWLCCFSS